MPEKTEAEWQAEEERIWEEEGIDIAHIMTASGCLVSFNGQGHHPCPRHYLEGDSAS